MKTDCCQKKDNDVVSLCCFTETEIKESIVLVDNNNKPVGAYATTFCTKCGQPCIIVSNKLMEI